MLPGKEGTMQCTTYPLLYSANLSGSGASPPVLRWVERCLDNGGICGFSLNLRVSENCSDGSILEKAAAGSEIGESEPLRPPARARLSRSI